MSLPTRVVRTLSDLPEFGGPEFNNFVDRLFNSSNGRSWASYPVDVREDADHIYVEADLPGFAKEQIDITIEDSTLTISAQRSTENKEQPASGEYLLNERRNTRFLRSFTLPPTVDSASVQAAMKDGVLTVTLNKRQETKPRKISVA